MNVTRGLTDVVNLLCVCESEVRINEPALTGEKAVHYFSKNPLSIIVQRV